VPTGVYQTARVAKTSNTTSSNAFRSVRWSLAWTSLRANRANSPFKVVLERTAWNAVFEEGNQCEKTKPKKKQRKDREEVKAGYFCRCLARARRRVIVCVFQRSYLSIIFLVYPRHKINCNRSVYFCLLNFGHDFSLMLMLSCKICWRIDGVNGARTPSALTWRILEH